MPAALTTPAQFPGMATESRAAVKRIATMLCAVAVLFFFGHAVGGAGGYLAGQGRPDVILRGLAGAAVFVWLSFSIWKSYLRDVAVLEGKDREDVGT